MSSCVSLGENATGKWLQRCVVICNLLKTEYHTLSLMMSFIVFFIISTASQIKVSGVSTLMPSPLPRNIFNVKFLNGFYKYEYNLQTILIDLTLTTTPRKTN